MSSSRDDFLKTVFQHILNISKGECTITDETVLSTDDALEQDILHGLLYLHEENELAQQDLRKGLEAEYRLKVLEEKNKELAQFNYIASHDLQEPLRTVISFSQLIARKNMDLLDESSRINLNLIIDASKRMKMLINGLLDYSRLGQGRVLTKINCQDMITEIQTDLTGSIIESQATIEVSHLPIIMGFELELRQLFQNLLSNALKFRSNDRATVIKVESNWQDDRWLFSVSDNGIGIRDQDQERIFGIFQRLHTREQYQGTGIGLSNCQKIVELHGGDIWVESALGEGSTFHFTLPGIFQKETEEVAAINSTPFQIPAAKTEKIQVS